MNDTTTTTSGTAAGTPADGAPAAGLTEYARTDSSAALHVLTGAVRALSEDALGEPSALPGWTRGHVLAHVDGVANALARQAEYAARGERVAPYDGGPAGRDAAIEAASTRSVAEHVAALVAARDRLAAAWPRPGAPGWDAPTSYREGPVTGCLLAWWREVRIHAVDARLGLGLDTWDAQLRAHLAEFLAVRLPADVVLSAGADGAAGALGVDGADLDQVRPPGTPTVVAGAPADVTAWLAGRDPVGPVRATRAGADVPLPELGPWPSAAR